MATLSAKKSTGFLKLVDQWEAKYGSDAGNPLLSIAEDRHAKDTDRYMALMAATKLLGARALSRLEPLLHDSSWMIRSAAMKSIAAMEIRSPTATHGVKIIALIDDPALVVRAEAAQTLGELNPPGATAALLKSIYDGKNYRPGDFRKGNADWVPQKALAALRRLKPKGISYRLLPLLNAAGDHRLRAHALFTIEALEGRHLKPNASFIDRARAWNIALAKR